jgi:hypothetical protein
MDEAVELVLHVQRRLQAFSLGRRCTDPHRAGFFGAKCAAT